MQGATVPRRGGVNLVHAQATRAARACRERGWEEGYRGVLLVLRDVEVDADEDALPLHVHILELELVERRHRKLDAGSRNQYVKSTCHVAPGFALARGAGGRVTGIR